MDSQPCASSYLVILVPTMVAQAGQPALCVEQLVILVRPGRPPAITKTGDSHAAPESLCRDDCLPRLIDAAAHPPGLRLRRLPLDGRSGRCKRCL